jgi:hypothetical protein
MHGKLVTFLFLVNLSLSCKTVDHDEIEVGISKADLDPAFNICSSWHNSMTWSDFQKIRTTWQRPELIRYVNKIQANAWLNSLGIPVIPIYFSREKKDDITTQLSELTTYVAKPSHMSANHGLLIVKDGKNLRTGQAITAQQVNKMMNTVLDTPSNSNEWLLQTMPRGFVIQEYIADSQEIKIQTIWGKAAEVSWFKNGQTYYYYTVDGTPMDDAPAFPYQQFWGEAIGLAEKIAARSDAMRIDMMIQVDSNNQAQKIMVNEIELRSQMGWPGSREFAHLLNVGYRQICNAKNG